MSNRFAYNVTNDSVSVIIDGRPRVVLRSAPNFLSLRDALLSERWDDARAHVEVGSSLMRWAQGRFTVTGNNVFFNGEPIPSDLNSRIVEMATAGESPEPLFKFWERLQRNPSARSVSQLWNFLNLIGIPLTESGHILAYKGVRTDLMDVYTGTIDNSPGAVIRVQRNRVSDDPKTPCHFGLHAGSLEYASSWGPRVVIVKIDPEHVVCVPEDHSFQKMRVCEYEVIGLHGEGHMPSTTIPDDDWRVDQELGAQSSYETDEDIYDEGEDYDGGVVVRLRLVEDAEVIEDSLQRRPLPTSVNGHRVPKWARKIHAMDEGDLHGVGMDLLRKYAGRFLRIVGAWRIRGGKDGLIAAIVKQRQ